MSVSGADALSAAINIPRRRASQYAPAQIKSSLKAFRRNFQARSLFRLFESYRNLAVDALRGDNA